MRLSAGKHNNLVPPAFGPTGASQNNGSASKAGNVYREAHARQQRSQLSCQAWLLPIFITD